MTNIIKEKMGKYNEYKKYSNPKQQKKSWRETEKQREKDKNKT
jgi:hypothetical protein